ncbi:MAG: signal peptidase II [Clostridiales bacterium]|nr:signal peptidase II [Clostridiales bacterium]
MVYGFVVLAVIFLDQLSKYFAKMYLASVDTIPIIQNVFHLTYRQNTGAAFSILRDNVSLLIVMTGIVIIGMSIFLYRLIRSKEHWLLLLSLSFVIGGAIGNLIDRINLSYVVDYFDFRLINFAVFNVADSFIVVGAVLIGVYILFIDGKRDSI